MKALSIFHAVYSGVITASAYASPVLMENPEAQHHLTKRMISASKAGNYFGGFLRVYQSEIPEWTTKKSGLLNSYLVFSHLVREEIANLKVEPYVPLLRAYSRQYAKQIYPDDPLAYISWQDFINEDLVRALHRPWGEKWKLPPFTLSPDDRIKGIPAGLLDKYPHAEIENEEDFNKRPLLRSDEITTVEYIAEFSLPFADISQLTNWLFNPVSGPARDPEPDPAIPSQDQDNRVYIELDRRERMQESLQAIYNRLKALVEDLKGFDLQTQFAGKIPIPPDTAQPIIEAVQKMIDHQHGWERVKDLVGVLITVMTYLAEEPSA
ncbi:hypothetical protein TWF506_002119 [Arthrobotrys conoides]|uniref:Uncharacterized protein n=1 Tax=Arthrobotrys conoides TaxID=74498 RepID=A0AAN8NIC0_9PEZI